MTLLRRFAVKVSAFVARHASPGWQEWAEGMAREVAYIEGNWAALSWALGSTRILLDYREAPIKSVADVPSAAYRFVERARSGYNFMWFMLLQGPVHIGDLWRATHWTERVGSAMAVGGSLCGWILLLVERRRLKKPYKDEIYDNAAACALFYKAELERYRFTLTIAICCFVCFCVGMELDNWHLFGGYAVYRVVWSLLSISLVIGFRHAQRTNRRRLERLDALLTEKS